VDINLFNEKMKKMKNILIIIVLALLTFNISYAQEMPNSNCTPTHRKAEFSMNYYLLDPYNEPARTEAGTNNISAEEISHVDNPIDCKNITNIINSNAKLKHINQNETTTKFYYQTNNFYYVFWREIHKTIIGGPKFIFVVINKNSEEIFISYM